MLLVGHDRVKLRGKYYCSDPGKNQANFICTILNIIALYTDLGNQTKLKSIKCRIK